MSLRFRGLARAFGFEPGLLGGGDLFLDLAELELQLHQRAGRPAIDLWIGKARLERLALLFELAQPLLGGGGGLAQMRGLSPELGGLTALLLLVGRAFGAARPLGALLAGPLAPLLQEQAPV